MSNSVVIKCVWKLQLFNYLIASVISIAGKPHYYAESIYIENLQRDGRKAIQDKTGCQVEEGIVCIIMFY